MLKYDFAKWSGWLSYTWSKAWYDIPGLNGGRKYRSPLNHEHAVNFVLTYDFTKRLSASAEWVFYSGAPTTYPVGRYAYKGTWVPVYSNRNEDTLPGRPVADLAHPGTRTGEALQRRMEPVPVQCLLPPQRLEHRLQLRPQGRPGAGPEGLPLHHHPFHLL